MKLKTGTALIAMMLAAGIAQAGGASSIVWDDFDTDPNTLLGGAATHNQTVISDPFSAGGVFSLQTGLVGLDGDIGGMLFTSGPSAVIQGLSAYGDLGGPAIWDMSALNASGFEFDFLTADHAFDVEIELSSGVSDNASGTLHVEEGFDQTLSFSFADLSASGAFDLSAVSSVSFRFNAFPDTAIALDFVTTEVRLSTVPTPGSLAMLGLGGLVATRRRR